MLPSEPTIVEVGPGTDQATKDLLARGASVHAVEIGPATAAKLFERNCLDPASGDVGDFEKIKLPGASADSLFSATAYHWISSAAQTDRPAYLLRPGGVVAIVDLIQVTSAVVHGFFDAAQPIYERYGEGHRGPAAPAREDVDPPMRHNRGPDVIRHCGASSPSWSHNESCSITLSFTTPQMSHLGQSRC